MFVDSILTTTYLIVFNIFSAARWQIMYLSAAISGGVGVGEGGQPQGHFVMRVVDIAANFKCGMGDKIAVALS